MDQLPLPIGQEASVLLGIAPCDLCPITRIAKLARDYSLRMIDLHAIHCSLEGQMQGTLD